MEEKFIVAFEIGSSKVKGALGAIDNSGILNVVAIQEEQLAESVRYGQIKNVEDVSNKIDSIRRKLENSKAIQPRKITGAYVGLSGLSVCSSNAEATIIFDGEEEVTADTISSLKEKAVGATVSDKDIYEVFPRGFSVDNMVTLNPVGTFANSIKGSFVIISGVPGLKNNINRVFPERLQIGIKGYPLSATALADTVLSTDEKQLGCMFVDFGAETTTVAIYKSGVIQYLATLPMGSRNITRDLVSLIYLEERAEAIKRSIGVGDTDGTPKVAGPDGVDQTEISHYITARASEIIANVMAQAEYAGLKTSDLPAGIIIVGGGSRLKGFSDMLTSRSQMKVRMGVLPLNIRISDASVAVNDAVDVIALLLQAGRMDPQECISPLIRNEQPRDDDPFPRTRHRNDYDPSDDEVRIGRDDDDDILLDDDERERRLHRHDRKKTIIKDSKPKGPSIYERIRQRLGNLMNDPNDRFDDEGSGGFFDERNDE